MWKRWSAPVRAGLATVVLALAACPLAGAIAASGANARKPAQEAPRDAGSRMPVQDTKPAVPAQAEFAVDGFRSAMFGMNEQQLRQALAKDFPGQKITVEQNSTDKTRALLVTVPDLVPGSGNARIAYILGHRSKTLMHVNIVWGAPVDSAASADQLVETARTLGTYLRGAGYPADSVIVDRGLPDGTIVVFRGSDAQGRTTSLVLRGTVAQVEAERRLTPTSLVLSYARDPKNPDVYRIEKGQF